MRGGIAQKGNNYYPYLWIGGKKKWFSGAGPSKKRAERILNDKVAELQNGTYQELKKIRFKAFASLWLDSYAKSKVKPSTLRSYEDIIEKHLGPAFGHFLLTDISTAMLQKYIADRLQAPKSKKSEQKVRAKTVINELVPLKEMLKHAVRWGYLKVNPAEYVEKPRVEKEEMDILPPEDIRLLLDHAAPRYRVLFLTAVLTGMRRGELLGLQWGDIDWNHGQIHVRRSLWKGQFVTPKSKRSVRKIDMSPTLARDMRRHRLQSPPGNLDLVFSNSKGLPLDGDTLVRRHFLPALRRAKVRQVRFHDLRHTNVALRIEQGQNIKYIQNQLGHASIQTTLDRYGHLIKDVNSEQALKLDTILGFVEKPGSSSGNGRKMVEEATKKGSPGPDNPLIYLVAGAGFEPATFGL
jgi:integrase